jgi:cupin fold WbuC family metalloprotein
MKTKNTINKESIETIRTADIRALKHQAATTPLRRARICLHRDQCDPLQDMVIVLCRDTHIAPHKHERKVESLHLIEGSFYLVTFDRHGRVVNKVLVSLEDPSGTLICRVKENVWHTLLPLSKFVVIHEVIRGPFQGAVKKKSASWAPQKKSEIKDFRISLLKGSPSAQRGRRAR